MYVVKDIKLDMDCATTFLANSCGNFFPFFALS